MNMFRIPDSGQCIQDGIVVTIVFALIALLAHVLSQNGGAVSTERWRKNDAWADMQRRAEEERIERQ